MAKEIPRQIINSCKECPREYTPALGGCSENFIKGNRAFDNWCPLKDAPEWKDKPDSVNELWFFDGDVLEMGKWHQKYCMCIPQDNNEGCTIVAHVFMDRWGQSVSGTWASNYYSYEGMRGKWQKAIVPEER